jgi:hypothetical protein
MLNHSASQTSSVNYVTEMYLNPSAFTAPAFRAGIRMANPPGKGTTEYPSEWRQGAEAFGRNYGDTFAQQVTFQTARFATGVVTHEDPRYIPSRSHNVFTRSLHALTFTFVDRSDSRHVMPACSRRNTEALESAAESYRSHSICATAEVASG